MVLELASNAKTVRNGLQLWMGLNPMSALLYLALGTAIRHSHSFMTVTVVPFSVYLC